MGKTFISLSSLPIFDVGKLRVEALVTMVKRGKLDVCVCRNIVAWVVGPVIEGSVSLWGEVKLCVSLIISRSVSTE